VALSSTQLLSTGRNRLSNFLELPSFHLRNTVHKIKTPPSEAATAIRIVITLLLFFSDWAARAIEGGAVAWTSTWTVLVFPPLTIVDTPSGSDRVAEGSGGGVEVGCSSGSVEDDGSTDSDEEEGSSVLSEALADESELAEAEADKEAEAELEAEEALAELAELELELADRDADSDSDSAGGRGTPMSVGNGESSSTSSCGARFLIMRLRWPWSRRWAWNSWASTTAVAASAMDRNKMSVVVLDVDLRIACNSYII